jgi:transcriptional regulator with XRE-family HTH domain
MVFISTTMRTNMIEPNIEMVTKYRGDLIIKLRQARGFSLRELAEKAGVSQTTIQKAENGQDIKISTLSGIATALGVDRRILLDMTLEIDFEETAKQAVESAIGKATEQQASAA